MRWSRIGLLVILAFDLWLRGHTFGPTVRRHLGVDLWPVSGAEAEPLDCDEAVFAYIGRRIVAGDVLYRDLADNKPPGGYWIYALAVAIGGADELTVRILPIPMVLATIVLVWWLGLRIRGPGAACLAALVYAVASTDPYLFGNGSNFEHAINLFSIAALATLIGAWDVAGRRWLFAAGACLGSACLVKQVVVLDLPIFAIALLCRRRGLGERLRDVAVLGLGCASVWGVAASALLVQGAGAQAYDDIVRYGAALATDTPPDRNAPPRLVRWFAGNADPKGVLPWPFGTTRYLVWWGTGTWPLWLAAIPSVIALGVGRQSSAPRRLVACWTLAAWVQAALPGLFWPHYYLLPLPGVAVAVSVHLADCLARARRGDSRRLLWSCQAAFLIAALAWTARIEVRDYLLVSPDSLAVRYKGGGQWVVLRAMGRDIARRSKIWASPRLFVWGWQSPLYIYGGLDAGSRQLFTDNLLKAYATRDHPLVAPRIERILRDLRARPPELILAGYHPFPALKTFLEEHYLPSHLDRLPDGRGLWVERGKFIEFEAFPSPGTVRRAKAFD